MEGISNFLSSKHMMDDMVNLNIIWRRFLIKLTQGRQAAEGTNNFLYSKHLIGEMVNLTIIWR